jgi:hypothetical protein
MFSFLKFFLQVGAINGIYGSIFGRPERYGIRGLYLDDESVIGGENGVLSPKLTNQNINKFFRHTLIPLPEYDFIVMDASEDIVKAIQKFNQSTKRLIPGGYILIKNTSYRCPSSGVCLIDHIKNIPECEILEFANDGIAIVRLKNLKLKTHNVRPLNAAFWVTLGALGGIVAKELLFNEERK